MALTKISTDGFKDDAVTVDKIANSINAARDANTAKQALTSNAVDTAKIADDAVTGAKIADGAISTAKIADDQITAAKIADGAVGTNALSNTNVTTAKIADEAVTLAKLEHGTSSNDGKFLRANNGADPSFETIAQPDLTNLSASNLTSGTIPDARFPATLPAVSGANLTGISGIPSGAIVLWSGATSAIPSGWVLCDGNNSTPDLRDRFVVGASDSTGDTSYPGVSPGATGGGQSGSITISVNGNTGWASQVPNASSTPNASPEPQNSRDRHQHGWGGNFPHSYDKMPPYYALAYIMKS